MSRFSQLAFKYPLNRVSSNVNHAIPSLPTRFSGCLRAAAHSKPFSSSSETPKTNEPNTDDPVSIFRSLLSSEAVLIPDLKLPRGPNSPLDRTFDAFSAISNKRTLNRTDYQSLLNVLLVNYQPGSTEDLEKAIERADAVLEEMDRCGYRPGSAEIAARLRLGCPSWSFPDILAQMEHLHREGQLTHQHVVIMCIALADRDMVREARRLVNAHRELMGLLVPAANIAVPLLVHILNNPKKFGDLETENGSVDDAEPPQPPDQGNRRTLKDLKSDSPDMPPIPAYLSHALTVWQRDLLSYATPLSLHAYSQLIAHLLLHDRLRAANAALDDALAHGNDLCWPLAAPFVEHFVGLGEVDKAMRVYTGVRGRRNGDLEPVPPRIWEVLIEGQLKAGNLRLAKELYYEGKKSGLTEGAIRRFRAGLGLYGSKPR